MNLKGTYTEKNLQKAIQGEALAYVKYQIYASLLGKESKDIENQINAIAHNEKEHFKVWLKLLLGDIYYNNETNLMQSICNEIEESENLYPEFARIAREEGFEDIANKFENIAKIEGYHAIKFDNILTKDLKELEQEASYECLNCGYICYGQKPDECPVCAHPKEYFKLYNK